MKTLVLASVSLLALGVLAPAGAADLPLYKAPAAPVLAFDWTGAYVGINGGGGLAHSCWGISNAGRVAVDPPIGEGCHNASGGTVGGQIGYRWQKGHWVLGVEGQGNWADFKGSNVSVVLAPLTNQTKINSFGLFTGQLGYAVNSLLFYGKAGAAVAHDQYDTFVPGAGAPAFNSVNQTRWGYSAGFGIEYGFAENWTVGGEYNHIFLGHHGAAFATLVGGLAAHTDLIGQDIDIGLIRVNYRWGGPLIAKY
ncbi:outer membrane beta-barrel protein [Bradyrhizobium sp. CB2312]|uniref:outer membrane protein n=1 Tax=Bradyrhizobium sp. CB2312 TaxID=3039155 RepID=UPI0024B09C06|nr:outer membrane beta-barrel protein [Bradyrhizobium sp. CB2312]WFU68469.1 outer membrane beta-barrel protein [Bradyrhizobium sp. CB2312]